MKAVLRLVWTYFTATRLMQGLSATGLALSIVGGLGQVVIPKWQLMQALQGIEVKPIDFFVITAPWLGLLMLLAATILLPAIVERITLGRSVWVLPGGRLKLLASVVLTALLLALIVATQAIVSFFDFTLQSSQARIFYRTLLMAFVDFGLIYTAVWLVGRTNGVWRLAGVLWVIVSITIPLRYVGGIPPFSLLEGLGLASWVLFALLLISGGRVRHAFRDVRSSFKRFARRMSPAVPYRPGKEVDLMLGMAQPWLIALGQIVPIAVMAALIRESSVWLVILMIFSAIAGAITSQAASRARRLWLRYDWTRDEIIHHVERAFWRYNVWSLGVLLVLYLALGVYADARPALIGHGMLLLVLGCTTCTYLGLMITRGLGWFESSLCILTLIALVIAAVATMRPAFDVTIELEILLAVLAVAYRYMALARWSALDWMRCRPEVEARHAG